MDRYTGGYMKKLTALLLAVFMGITGCSSPGKDSGNKTPGSSASEASVNKENQEPEREYQIIRPEEVPDGLDTFLNDFAWAVSYDGISEDKLGIHEYDCTDGRETWIFNSLIWITNFFEGYDVTCYYDEDNSYEYVYDADDIDWILKNIYNFSPSVIEKVKQEGFSDYVTYSDGKYRGWPLGAWDIAYGAKNFEAAYNGRNYLVAYDCGSAGIGDLDLVLDTPVSKHYALMEYKTINGMGYWSIYKDTIYMDQIEGCAELFGNEGNQEGREEETKKDDPAGIEETADVTDWNYIAEKYYEIYLGYLDFINSGGDTAKLVNVDPEQKNRFAENYIKYNSGHTFTNQIFDFDTTAGKITDLGGGMYEADCYVVVMNTDRENETGNVTSNNVTIHAKLRYTPEEARWILTLQKGESYSYSGHTMIHCGK